MEYTDELYKEMILDLFRNPRNKRTIDSATSEQRGYNPHCGDDITIQIVRDENIIKDIAFTGSGCAISQAALSLLTEEVKGKKSNDISALTDEDMIAKLGVPISETRKKCALLGLRTLKHMIKE